MNEGKVSGGIEREKFGAKTSVGLSEFCKSEEGENDALKMEIYSWM